MYTNQTPLRNTAFHLLTSGFTLLKVLALSALTDENVKKCLSTGIPVLKMVISEDKLSKWLP